MADIDFTFSGDSSSLKQALAEIKDEVRKTKEGVSSLATKFGAVILAAQGAVAALRATYAAVSNIPGQAARMENLVTVFTSLSGSAETARTLISDLWHDAANGAVGLEEMAAAAKPLVSVFSNVDTIREWTNRFADISAGSGIAADALSKVYARAVTLGKVDSKAIESLAKQGVPIYQRLGEVIGASASRVKELAKDGAISADQYSAALRKMTDAGGEYFQLSSQLSNTSGGSWDTLVENVNRLAAALGTPINAAITPVLQSIAAAVEAAMPKVEEFSRAFVAGFEQAVSVLSPIVEAIASVSGALGGAKTIIAAAAAAMLMYAGNAQTATVSTAAMRTQVSSLSTSLKGMMSMSAVSSAFKNALLGMRSALTTTLAGMRVAWTTTWTTMAAVARTAVVTVKAALISTGIGLIIVGIGEALGALYNWFAGNNEAAEQAAESARAFAQSLKDLEKQAEKVSTQEQMDSFMSQLNEQIEELREARRQAYEDEDWDKGEQLTAQLKTLWEKQAAYKKTLSLQVEEAARAADAAAQMRKQREEAEALAQSIEMAKEKMAELQEKQRSKTREDYLSGLDTGRQISLRLSDVGMRSMEELSAAIKNLEMTDMVDENAVADYERLVATFNKITELQRKATQEEREKKKALADNQARYDEQTALLQAQIDGNSKLAAKLREQQRVVQLTEEYRRQGFRNAVQMAEQLVQMEKQATAKQAQGDYTQQIELAKAQIAGDERKLNLLRQQQRIVELTERFRSQGLANAEAKAKRLAALEAQAAEAAEAVRHSQNATRISNTTASVGGGGRSVVIGGPMLSESKKHTALLREVGSTLKRKQTIQISGQIKAVIGR